ncbi:MAG: ABC transporter permease [Eubacterium sp.]|nr:ABC transporter permease [Eubacterium sp.]
MFFHNLKYEVMVSLRARDLIIWLMLFPIVLGTFFKIAFGNIYEKENLFKTIDTAVVMNVENETFRQVVKNIEASEKPLLKAVYTDEKTAEQKLKDGEVKGIIYVSDDLSLSVASNDMESTILKKFLENYKANESVILDTIAVNPENIEKVTGALSADIKVTSNIPLTNGNTDFFITYFYNLIAMVAMFGSVTGIHIAIENQGNLSPLGARRCCSPTPKFTTLFAGLVGSYLAQTVCIILCITFEVLVLGIDYGSRLPLVFIAGILGGITGVSFGFFVGSISNLGTNAKIGISMAVSMVMCFLSGLMLGDIKPIIEKNAPIVNDLNPAAIISDSIYYLNVDDDLGRFYFKLFSMIILSMIFVFLGFLLTRKKKYASL